MTSDKLREVLRAEPFQPFVLHLTDGRSFEVRHPEQMALSPSGRIAYLFISGDRHDSGHHIDVLMTDLEVRTLRGDGRAGGGRRDDVIHTHACEVLKNEPR